MGELLTWPAPTKPAHPLILADTDLMPSRASHLHHNWFWGAWRQLSIPISNEQRAYNKTSCELGRMATQELAPFYSLSSVPGLAASFLWNNLLTSWGFIVRVVICGAWLLTNFPFSLNSCVCFFGIFIFPFLLYGINFKQTWKKGSPTDELFHIPNFCSTTHIFNINYFITRLKKTIF